MDLWHCGGCLNKQAARYARRQAPATNRPTQRTKPSNRLKSKAAAKIRRHAQAFRVRRIFLHRRDLWFLITAHSSQSVIRTVFLPPLRYVMQNRKGKEKT